MINRLSPAQYRALGNLVHNTKHARWHVNHLSALDINLNTCDALADRGLLEFYDDEAGPQVRVTSQGRQVLEHIDAMARTRAQEAIEEDPYALDDEECQHLLQATAPTARQEYWRLAPHPVRVRLVAKGMLTPPKDTTSNWEVTPLGHQAIDRTVRISMGLDPVEPPAALGDIERATLHGAVDLDAGKIGPFADVEATELLRQLGYVRRMGEGAYVTAAGHVAAGRSGDMEHLVELAAADYMAMLEQRKSDLKARRTALWHRQDQWFFTLSCPPGVDQEIFVELVRELAKLRLLCEEENERHRQVMHMNESEQKRLLYRANRLGVASGLPSPGEASA